MPSKKPRSLSRGAWGCSDTNVLASGFVGFAAADRAPARLLHRWQEQRCERVLSADISRGKAFTAAAFQRDSGQLGGSPFFASGPQVGGGMIVALPGGVPIRDGDEVVGAIGCGGGTGEQDVECSQAGIAALSAMAR